MPPPEPPHACQRRRRASSLLEAALGAVLLALLVGRLLRPRGEPEPGPWVPLAVDLARDPYDRLILLPGVGPARAAALLEDRRRRGPPRSREDLLQVPGIGPALLAALGQAQELRALCDGRPLAEGGP